MPTRLARTGLTTACHDVHGRLAASRHTLAELCDDCYPERDRKPQQLLGQLAHELVGETAAPARA